MLLVIFHTVICLLCLVIFFAVEGESLIPRIVVAAIGVVNGVFAVIFLRLRRTKQRDRAPKW